MSDKRAIRVLMTADAVGGVWQYATELAAGLSKHGIETLLAVFGPQPTAAQRGAAALLPGTRLIETGLPLDWLSDAASAQAAAVALADIARSESVDLIHLNSPALAAEQNFGVPVLGSYAPLSVLGLTPLCDNPFTRMKTYTKWVEYTDAGLPVIASDHPIYRDCCADGAALLVKDSDWATALPALLGDAPARQAMLDRARARVGQDYSVARLREHLLEVFRRAGLTL